MHEITDIYNSYLEVDLEGVCDNYRRAKAAVGVQTDIIPVLKSNAYHLGAIPVAEALLNRCHTKIIALAHLSEGVQMRMNGISPARAEIMLVGAIPMSGVKAAVEQELILPVYSREMVECLAAEVRRTGRDFIEVQIAVNTGLNRLGVRPGRALESLLDCLQEYREVIRIKGVYSHLATGQQYNSEFAREQNEKFERAWQQITARGIRPRYKHICDSGASDWFREALGTHVRLARRLYMGQKETQLDLPADLIPVEVASWRTSVLSIIRVKQGESLGYDRAYRAPRDARVAVIGVGYGDGLYRGVVGPEEMAAVGSEKTCFLGMCMDVSFLDVTHIPCEIGMEVTLFGRGSSGVYLSLEDTGKKAGLDGCYLLSFLTDRVARVYVNG